MMFGHCETDAERFEHMTAHSRATGRNTACSPRSFRGRSNRRTRRSATKLLEGRGNQKATVAEYLRTLSLSRLFLQNVPHIQSSSFVTQGMKTCQIGSDDGRR